MENFLTNFVSFRRGANLASFFNAASFLSMRGILPPIFRFFSLVSPWVRKFFIRLTFRFFFLVFHWIRRFYIYHALLTKLRKLYFYMPTHLVKLMSYKKGNYNIMIFKIKVIWHIIDNVTSLNIDFHFIYLFTFLYKILFHHINDTTGLSGMKLYIT